MKATEIWTKFLIVEPWVQECDIFVTPVIKDIKLDNSSLPQGKFLSLFVGIYKDPNNAYSVH